MSYQKPIDKRNNPFLSEKITIEDIIKAFKNEEDRFEIPFKPYELDLTKNAVNTLYGVAAVIALGMVVSRMISKDRI